MLKIEQTVTLKELAARTSISFTELHYLVKQGILPAETQISEGGHTAYFVAEKNVLLLLAAKDLVSLGYSLTVAFSLMEKIEPIQELGDNFIFSLISFLYAGYLKNEPEANALFYDQLISAVNCLVPIWLSSEEVNILKLSLEGQYPTGRGRKSQTEARKLYRSACQKLGELCILLAFLTKKNL